MTEQLSAGLGDASNLGDIYRKIQQLSTAINDPRIMGCVCRRVCVVVAVASAAHERWSLFMPHAAVQHGARELRHPSHEPAALGRCLRRVLRGVSELL